MDKGNIFSILYKDYKNKIQNEMNVNQEGNADNKQNEKKRNNIDNLNVEKNSDFKNIIVNKFNEIKDNTIKKMNNCINKYKTSFDEYIKNISKYLDDSKNNINKIFVQQEDNNKILLNFISKNIFKQLNNLLLIYDNIINNIEDNFDLLNIYLSKKELIDSKKPLEQFLNYFSDNIKKSSIISKFTFEDINPLNIIQKNKYYKFYFNYLNEEEKNLPIKILSINRDTKTKNEIKLIKDYYSFKNLEIINYNSNELQNILEAINNAKSDLNKISINNFDLTAGFQENRLNNNKLNKIKKLKIHNGKYYNNILLSKIFLNKGEYLKILSLEKINLTNMGWKKLLNYIYDNQIILENIEYLSLSGNKITSINNEKNEENIVLNQDKIFKKLKIFNLSKNEIYKFGMSPMKFPELKLLDLTSNSIPTGVFMEFIIGYIIESKKNMLCLLNDNIFMTNNSENNKIYIDHINKQFPKNNSDLKNINLRFTYDIENQNNLKNLIFTPAARISLIKLDLSFCGLTSNIIINFLKNNYGLFSLKNLKLKYNDIKIDIFEKMLEDEIKLDNLNVIDLSHNEIQSKKVEEHSFLIKFIKKFSNLTKIKLKYSNFYEIWITNTSTNYDNSKQFSTLYVDLIKYLRQINRKFNFVVEQNDTYLEDNYRELFTFRND